MGHCNAVLCLHEGGLSLFQLYSQLYSESLQHQGYLFKLFGDNGVLLENASYMLKGEAHTSLCGYQLKVIKKRLGVSSNSKGRPVP